MAGLEQELDKRSKYLSNLIQYKKLKEQEEEDSNEFNVRVRASDMPSSLQKRAFKLARDHLNAMPREADKHLAIALKKEFDSVYGPAWHCIVGTSFGSYVTHSLGGFLYIQMDKVYVLLFKTVVKPLYHHQ